MVQIRIQFSSSSNVFRPGQQVQGNVFIESREEIKARSVVVQIHGEAKTEWNEHETRKKKNPAYENALRNQHRNLNADGTRKPLPSEYVSETVYIPYHSTINYIGQEMCVWTANASNRLPVENAFPFSFTLPVTCPPSYEGGHGHIRYWIKVKIDRPWHIDSKEKAGFKVVSYFDLNTVPQCLRPAAQEMEKSPGFFLFKKGKLYVKVILPKTGFVPNESIPVKVEIQNSSNKEVSRVDMQLIRCSLFTADRHEGHQPYGTFITYRHRSTETKESTHTVAECTGNLNAPKQANGSYQVDLKVPQTAPTFNICPIIIVSYFLKVKVTAKGSMNNTMKFEFPVLIGTEKVPETVPNAMPRGVPERMPNGFPSSVPNGMPGEVPNGYPGGAPDRTPEVKHIGFEGGQPGTMPSAPPPGYYPKLTNDWP